VKINNIDYEKKNKVRIGRSVQGSLEDIKSFYLERSIDQSECNDKNIGKIRKSSIAGADPIHQLENSPKDTWVRIFYLYLESYDENADIPEVHIKMDYDVVFIYSDETLNERELVKKELYSEAGVGILTKD